MHNSHIKFGLITYPLRRKEANLGDYIQVLAARQFLPKVDVLLNREHLDTYRGDPVIAIMNGWFMHNPESFPPNDNIIPIFVSFHISDFIADKLLNQKVIDYLHKYEPIGCRDKYTTKLLQDRGIRAYFSGCLTLTLKRRNFIDDKIERKKSELLLSDVLYFRCPVWRRNPLKWHKYFKWHLNNINYRRLRNRIFKKIKIAENGHEVESVTHFVDGTFINDEKRILMAEDLLRRYANSKLVVTSRLHTALPCLAFGTPVLFVVKELNDVRFSGFEDLLNVITPEELIRISKSGEIKMGGRKVKWKNIKNKTNYLPIRKRLIEFVSKKLEELCY